MSTKVRVNLREMYPKYYNQECFIEIAIKDLPVKEKRTYFKKICSM